ncbi:hypothetical protein SLS59_005181 [Nothophoma quercina]|uniref:Uncharacterized protein n=1 Tax=Nothophoma quercina TaxID=749835 RepID=A0ABR3RC47_9PLEO
MPATGKVYSKGWRTKSGKHKQPRKPQTKRMQETLPAYVAAPGELDWLDNLYERTLRAIEGNVQVEAQRPAWCNSGQQDYQQQDYQQQDYLNIRVAPTFNYVEECNVSIEHTEAQVNESIERTKAQVNELIALLQDRKAQLQAQAEMEMVDEIAEALFPYNYLNAWIPHADPTDADNEASDSEHEFEVHASGNDHNMQNVQPEDGEIDAPEDEMEVDNTDASESSGLWGHGEYIDDGAKSPDDDDDYVASEHEDEEDGQEGEEGEDVEWVEAEAEADDDDDDPDVPGLYLPPMVELESADEEIQPIGECCLIICRMSSNKGRTSKKSKNGRSRMQVDQEGYKKRLQKHDGLTQSRKRLVVLLAT